MELRGVRKRIEAVAAGGDPDKVFTGSAALIREGATISRTTFDRIEALEEPPATRDAVAAWLASNRRQVALTDDLAKAFDGQDETQIAKLSEQLDVLDERNNATARGFGMRICAERVQK